MTVSTYTTVFSAVNNPAQAQMWLKSPRASFSYGLYICYHPAGTRNVNLDTPSDIAQLHAERKGGEDEVTTIEISLPNDDTYRLDLADGVHRNGDRRSLREQ